MPASKEKRLDALNKGGTIKKLGILAGGGQLPEVLIRSCEDQGIDCFVVGFEAQTEAALVEGRTHFWGRLGQVGKILKALRDNGVEDLVLIGSIRRPSLPELMPDMKAAAFFAKIGLRAMGDSDLLSALREMLEDEGFRLHGAHKFSADLLAPEGCIGAHEPTQDDWVNITRGIEIARALGALDVGQACIVQEGLVLGVEAVEGTDALIERCDGLQRAGRGGVLVKLCKPQQDTDLDLPTIGPATAAQAVQAGLSGIVIHAGQSLLLERESVAEIANKHKMFVLGIDLSKSD